MDANFICRYFVYCWFLIPINSFLFRTLKVTFSLLYLASDEINPATNFRTTSESQTVTT